MAKYTEAQKKATMKYMEKLKDVRFRITPEEYTAWTEAAKAAGFTKADGTANMRQFIIAAVTDKIKWDMHT